MNRTARGFTVIEVTIALLVSAFVVLIAREIVQALGDTSVRVRSEASSSTARAHARDVLRHSLMMARVGDSTEFVGSDSLVSFETYCAGSEGFLEPCSARLAIRHRDSAIVTLVIGSNAPLEVGSGRPGTSLLFLESAVGGGAWSHTWQRQRLLPVAVGIALGRDTILLALEAAR